MLRPVVVGAAVVWLAATLLRAQAPVSPGPGHDLAPSSGGATQANNPGTIDFVSQIQPILAEFCEDCHDAETRKGGLSLATYADLLEGGRSGAVVRPGNSGRSLLIDRLTGAVEPSMPKDEDPLDASRLAIIRAWIDEGARATPASPPAPQPWEAPLTLRRPELPETPWPAWSGPVDRIVAAYLTRTARLTDDPGVVDDARFARRAYLDVWGLLPEPDVLQAFLADTAADKRADLVARLLADRDKYAEHWMTFWNDLLRNEDGVTYFAQRDGRRSITPWLLKSLRGNLPYDQFVRQLLNPSHTGAPVGFLTGVNWRGETSAAVTPWMQASQNTAQIFLGVNMKCNACHDSFVSRWKLADAYGLAAFFSPEPRLRLYRCDVARDEYTGPRFPFGELNATPRGHGLDDRRAAAASLFTDPRNGRLPRTLVNRLWERLLGRGIVANADEMDTRPWSPELLDWLANDFVEHGYDVQQLIARIMTSRAYQLTAVARAAEPAAKGYVFTGPEVRRLSAEQFADVIGTLTGEWSTWPGPGPRASVRYSRRIRRDSDPRSIGEYGREWRAASTELTRALGRPIRDQVISVRADDATTPQALVLVNGGHLTTWLERGARRLVGEAGAKTYSRFTATIAGRVPRPRGFDVDVSSATSLWLVVQDAGSNAPERVQPVWRDAVLIDTDGRETSLATLTAARGGDESRRSGTGTDLRVGNPSWLEYDLEDRRFVRLRGVADVANPRSEIGATLSPAIRFFVFDAEPDAERLLPPVGQPPLPPPQPAATPAALVERVFWLTLGRAPTATERRLAEAAATDAADSGRLSASGVADLIWAVLMKPEFQLIY